MKLWALAPIALGLLVAFQKPVDDTRVVILTGDMDGLLTPCGCTRPMSGGIRRLATAIKGLSIAGRTSVIANGGLVAGTGRQDELKLETFAQALKAMNVSALRVGSSEAALGRGELLAMANIMDGRLVSSAGIRELSDNAFAAAIEDGPFLIGASGDHNDIKILVQQATERKLKAVLLCGGGLSEARSVARLFPSLALIQYRAGGHPARSWQGNTLIATPGEKGKEIVRLLFRRGRFVSYSAIDLGPQYNDDANASRIFNLYLSRVSAERLAERSPRTTTKEFAGSESCAACHSEAFKVWEHSGHAAALKTLKAEGEQGDPDCLRCHVVGFDSAQGYFSEPKTPSLGAVGCENCHGPAKEHSLAPYTVRLTKVTENQCVSCHTTEQSPNFEFDTFWPRIRHK